jgi:hypothetical protein
MIELLLFIGAIALGIAVIVGVVKLLFAVMLLPFKAAIWIGKGLFGLLIALPVLVIVLLVVTNVVPLVLFALLLPIILFIAGVALLLKLIF